LPRASFFPITNVPETVQEHSLAGSAQVQRNQVVVTFASHIPGADRIVALAWLPRQAKPEKVIYEAAAAGGQISAAAP
jgi:hypothetical protein